MFVSWFEISSVSVLVLGLWYQSQQYQLFISRFGSSYLFVILIHVEEPLQWLTFWRVRRRR